MPQGVTENDLVDFTPEIKAEALRVAHQFRLGRPLCAAVAGECGRMERKGTLTAPSAVGGVNWPGGAVDPVDDVLYVASENTLYRAQVTRDRRGRAFCTTTLAVKRVTRRRRCSAFRSSSLPMGGSRPSI